MVTLKSNNRQVAKSAKKKNLNFFLGALGDLAVPLPCPYQKYALDTAPPLLGPIDRGDDLLIGGDRPADHLPDANRIFLF